MDCANGATSVINKTIFEELGAKVELINADSQLTAPKSTTTAAALISKAYKSSSKIKILDFGVAFDGDGDRCLMVDQKWRSRRRRPNHRHPRKLPQTRSYRHYRHGKSRPSKLGQEQQHHCRNHPRRRFQCRRRHARKNIKSAGNNPATSFSQAKPPAMAC